MRLFVAVWPPSDVVDALTALQRPELPGVRWTTADQWHVTLRFFGSVPSEELGAITRRIESVMAPSSVEVSVGPMTACFGRSVLYLPTSGLDALAATTVAATEDMGAPPDPRPFAGHLTLARGNRRSRTDLRSLAGTPVSGSWTVNEITLVASHPDRGGSRYEVVARHLI